MSTTGRKAAKQKMTKTRLETAARHGEALRLRRAGKSYDAIAAALGYSSRSSALRAVQSEMHRVVTEPAEDLLQLELERLDALHDSFWPTATRSIEAIIDLAEYGDTRTEMYQKWEASSDQKRHAAGVILKVSERRAKLRGLDDYEKRMAEVAERKQALDEAQARLIAGAVMTILSRLDLTPEQKKIAALVAPEQLRAISQ